MFYWIVFVLFIDSNDSNCPQTRRAAGLKLWGSYIFYIKTVQSQIVLLHCCRRCDELQPLEASGSAESLKHDGAFTEGKGRKNSISITVGRNSHTHT